MEHGTNFRAPYLFLLYINKYFTESTAPTLPLSQREKVGAVLCNKSFVSPTAPNSPPDQGEYHEVGRGYD